MQVLSNGYKKPSTGDKGSVFFVALEEDIQLLNDHTHNGLDSYKIPSSSSYAGTTDVLAAGWGSPSGGTYSQTVSLPAGYSYDLTSITYREAVSGDIYLLRTDKVSASQFKVYCNDNTLSFKAVLTT